jgi:hypothetical protein
MSRRQIIQIAAEADADPRTVAKFLAIGHQAAGRGRAYERISEAVRRLNIKVPRALAA